MRVTQADLEHLSLKVDRVLLRLNEVDDHVNSLNDKVDQAQAKPRRTLPPDRWTLLPAGIYGAQIVDAQLKQSQSEKWYWSIAFALDDSTDWPGLRVWGNFITHIPSPFDRVCNSFSIETHTPAPFDIYGARESYEKFLQEALEGQECRIRVERTTFMDKTHNRVDEVLPR
jgi:hypothetical protein